MWINVIENKYEPLNDNTSLKNVWLFLGKNEKIGQGESVSKKSRQKFIHIVNENLVFNCGENDDTV